MFSNKELKLPENVDSSLEGKVQTLQDQWRELQRFFRSLNNRGVLGRVTSWAPAITFATPGNLSVTYTNQIGQVTQFGPFTLISFDIITSGFTHTTASGSLSITGCPVLNRSTAQAAGAMTWQGITKANYTQMNPVLAAGGSTISVIASGSGQTGATIAFGDMPTGGTVAFRGSILILA
jgi:hypothetical protein